MMNRKATILGTEYTIEFGTPEQYELLNDLDGFTDSSVHLIVVDDMTCSEEKEDSKKDLGSYRNQVLRHEIIHAYLEESGLSANSNSTISWATNEEMVDWLAIQLPKIYETFMELDILKA